MDNHIQDMMACIQQHPQHFNFFLTRDPPAGTGYCFWRNEAMEYVIKRCGDDHSGASFAFCLRAAVQRLRNVEEENDT